MKVGLIYNVDIANVGPYTYFFNYVIPLLSSAEDVELYYISYKGLGSSKVENLPSNVKVIEVSHDTFDSKIDEIEELDVIHTSSFNSYYTKKEEYIHLYDDLCKTKVPIVTVLHAVTQFLRWSLDKSIITDKSFLAHPNTRKVIQFREGYYDLFITKFLKKHGDDWLAIREKSDFVTHQPWVGYLDRDNLVPWKDRGRNIGYAGRFNGAKRGYVFMNSGEYLQSFDKMVVATNTETLGYWDKTKLDKCIESVGDKLDLIPKFSPDDVPSIANKIQFAAFPINWEDIEFPNEWMYQELLSCGVIPITSTHMTKKLPKELEDVLVFSHKPTTSPIDYDSMVSQYSNEDLEAMSSAIVDYANKNWHDKELAISHLIDTYTQAIGGNSNDN
ncbi:glycosyl transferase [Listeria phage LIS04]|nr:glycosyl transferase [Listeria phage LIS04]